MVDYSGNAEAVVLSGDLTGSQTALCWGQRPWSRLTKKKADLAENMACPFVFSTFFLLSVRALPPTAFRSSLWGMPTSWILAMSYYFWNIVGGFCQVLQKLICMCRGSLDIRKSWTRLRPCSTYTHRYSLVTIGLWLREPTVSWN